MCYSYNHYNCGIMCLKIEMNIQNYDTYECPRVPGSINY